MLKRHHLLYACSLLMDLNVAGVTFAFSRRAAELGASATELGLLGAMWVGVYALAALGTGRMADRIGHALIARTGCVICLLCALGYAYITDTKSLLALSCVYGIGLASFWPPVIAWLGKDAGDSTELNTRLSNFSIAFSIGFVIGFWLIGLLYTYSPRLGFFVPAGLYCVVIALLTLANRIKVIAPVAGPIAALPKTPAIPKGRGFRKCAWLANFAICFSTAGVSALFPQLATHLHINAEIHGDMLAFFRFASILGFIAMQLLTFWRTRLWPLWVAQLAAALALAWIGWANSTWMFFIAFAVAGAVSGYAYQASIYFTLEEVTEKGEGVGFHEAILGGGLFIGPVLAGWVGQHYSIRAPYFFCAVALVVLVVAQLILVLVRRKASAPISVVE